MKRNHALYILSVFVLLSLAGCTANPNPMVNKPDVNGEVAGFWLGLWQGMICPITFFLSLFKDSVHFYEVHNNGVWYNWGFLIGAGLSLGGGSKFVRIRKKVRQIFRSRR